MQSIGKLVASQANYYTEQLTHSVGEDVPVLRSDQRASQTDYYAAHESPSRWMGTGLTRLGIGVGESVGTEVFGKLMAHQTPSGESMTRRYASHGKVAAYDHTFSAPKSVSLLFAFGDEQARTQVVESHHQAVTEAVSYMEQNCSQSRLATKHRDDEGRWKVNTRTIESEGYLAAGFDHFTSRANDPQVHTHVVVINRVWAQDGWRAIDAKRAYAHAKAGGTVYQAVLRDQLTQRLGVSWQPVVDGLSDIEGLSAELLRHFSTRRTEIVEAVERYLAQNGGEAHRRMYQAFTLETREPKAYPQGEAAVTRKMKDYGITDTVEQVWAQRATQAPQDVAAAIHTVITAGRAGIRPDTDQIQTAAAQTVEWISDRHAVFTQRDLLAQVATLYPEGATRTELENATQLILDTAQQAGLVITVLPTNPDQITLPEGINLTADETRLITDQTPGWISQNNTVRFRALPGEPRYTTRIQLEREAQVLTAVTDPSPITIDPTILETAINCRGLTDRQAQAIRHLSDLDSRLVVVVGPGGSGKTHAIAAYAQAVQAAGHPVVGVATSAAAARQLGESLGPSTWTGTIAMLDHHHTTSGKPLAVGTVVICDEASMVSTRNLAWLVKRVTEADGKLILVGDPKQLPSVDSGGLFHRIVAAGDQVVDELAQVNQRQQLDLDRHNLNRIRQGEIRQAIHDYREAGRLHLGRDEYATKAAMVDAWWADVQTTGLDHVRMLASRHDEVWMLNQLARVHMAQAGLVSGPAVANRWGLEFQTGDRIVVRDNWYAHSDLRNGQTGTVIAVHPHTGSLTFRRDLDGETIELPRRYLDRNVDHAYAQTIHTAQGQTFGITHLYTDTGVKKEHGYTALSRARGETHLWVNDTPGPLGGCTHIHGDPLTEDRIEFLVRQLADTVIEAPAIDQGLPVHTATDRQLLEWRDQLDQIIRNSPLTKDPSDDLVAIEAAIEQTKEIAERLGTSGAKAQVQYLETQRDQLLEYAAQREEWIDNNTPILRRYSAVAEELQHRIAARVAAYEINPPQEILDTLGPLPTEEKRRRQWRTAAAIHAETRTKLGPKADLNDPALLQAAPWREAQAIYRTPEQRPLEHRRVIPRRASSAG